MKSLTKIILLIVSFSLAQPAFALSRFEHRQPQSLSLSYISPVTVRVHGKYRFHKRYAHKKHYKRKLARKQDRSFICSSTAAARKAIFPMIEVYEDGKDTNPYSGMFVLFDWELINARNYLIKTATPGGTMKRQGVAVSIGRLLPDYAKRAAKTAFEARNSGIKELRNAGLYSAYREPGQGIGGFHDKCDSLHGVGGAADWTGIGRPGSRATIAFNKIAARNGLYNPYGSYNRAEWNHYQVTLIKIVLRDNPVRATVASNGPTSKIAMWSAAQKMIAKIGLPPIITVVSRRHRHYQVASK